ncbi:MAG TPA: carboxypeptidase regulatory-like domain-containing protein [Pyrinomonadaceae bacterium]
MNLDWASGYSWKISQLVLGLTVVLLTNATITSSQTRKPGPASLRHSPTVPNDNETTVNLRDFGAVGDGETNDGPALQSALDVLANAGGGTLYVPPGEYAIISPVGKQFSSSASITIQGEPSNIPIDVGPNGLGLGLTSEFVIKVGETLDAISISGAGAVHFSDISFIGVPEVINDAHIVLKLTDISDARIQHCEFYGLASLVFRGALVYAFHSDLTIQDTPFLGCATSSGHSTSVVENVRWQGISLINSKFIDYGQRPEFFSKTPLSASYSWLGIGNAAALEPSDSRREAIVQNVFMDEGQYFGISAIPNLFDNAPSAPIELYLSQVTMNVSNLASAGIYLDSVQKLSIDRSYFGWSHNAGAAIYLTNVGEAILDQVECAAHANTIFADAATERLVIINSIYSNLVSAAPDTVTITTPDLIEDPVYYVRQQYLNVVGHEPDPVGQYYWADLILRCQSNQTCRTQNRNDLADYLEATPSSKFSINGTVEAENGIPLAGAVVLLSGSQSVSTISDASGQYSFQEVATAGTYVITATKRHYTFPSLAFETPGEDQIGDFTGVLNRHTISGRVATPSGQPIAGAVLELSDENEQTETTDANGNYSFPNLPAGRDYTVTVSRSNYSFADSSSDFFDLSGDGVANFTGTLATYTLSGRITNNRSVPLPGVAVNLSGARVATTSTDSQGRYSFAVTALGNYVVTPVLKHYRSYPQKFQHDNLGSSLLDNFAFFPEETMHVDGIGLAKTSTVNPDNLSGSGNINISNPKGQAPPSSARFLGIERVSMPTMPDQPTPVRLANPIDDPRTFVSQQYSDLLGRAPDAEDLDYWTSEITRCGDDTGCTASMRVAVSTAFLTGPEFHQSGAFIYRLFRTALGSRPTFSQFQDERQRLQSIEDSGPPKTVMVRNFILSPEFLAQYPNTLPAAQFIDRLLSSATQNTGANLAGLRQSLLAEYRTNHDRGRVLQLVADNELVQKAETNGALVLMQYFGYLQRDPDEAGYAFWLDVLNHQQPGSFRGMICAFINAREYQERFGPVVSRDASECRSIR